MPITMLVNSDAAVLIEAAKANPMARETLISLGNSACIYLREKGQGQTLEQVLKVSKNSDLESPGIDVTSHTNLIFKLAALLYKAAFDLRCEEENIQLSNPLAVVPSEIKKEC